MVQYYWNPNLQHVVPRPGMAHPVPPPAVTIPAGGRPPGPPQREESFIENILRLNIGNPGIFHFSFEHAIRTGINTLEVVGSVEAAGRDHVIIKETSSGHQFLFPMIYFDFAEFPGEVKYFNQHP
jgi:spore germination protein Q